MYKIKIILENCKRNIENLDDEPYKPSKKREHEKQYRQNIYKKGNIFIIIKEKCNLWL